MRHVACLAVSASVALLSTACGPMLWGLTPKQEPTFRETLRMDHHVVDGGPPGAHLVRVPTREIRAERRKARWPTALGMAVDIVGGAFLALMTQHVTDEPPATVTVGATMLGVVVLDVYLMANRSLESEPVAFEEWHEARDRCGTSCRPSCGPLGHIGVPHAAPLPRAER